MWNPLAKRLRRISRADTPPSIDRVLWATIPEDLSDAEVMRAELVIIGTTVVKDRRGIAPREATTAELELAMKAVEAERAVDEAERRAMAQRQI